jgi:hypothetical protein
MVYERAKGTKGDVGCIQALKCNTNRCPTGVATQDPGLARALHVPDKTAAQLVASMGLDSFAELDPSMLNRRSGRHGTRTYAALYEWLMPGELLEDPAPLSWRSDWVEASADEFR